MSLLRTRYQKVPLMRDSVFPLYRIGVLLFVATGFSMSLSVSLENRYYFLLQSSVKACDIILGSCFSRPMLSISQCFATFIVQIRGICFVRVLSVRRGLCLAADDSITCSTIYLLTHEGSNGVPTNKLVLNFFVFRAKRLPKIFT